jgi:hypothetical protein
MSTLAEEITLLKERFDALTKDLARMGRSKRGTAWHLNRVAERMRLGRQIDRLESIDPTPSYGRFSVN